MDLKKTDNMESTSDVIASAQNYKVVSVVRKNFIKLLMHIFELLVNGGYAIKSGLQSICWQKETFRLIKKKCGFWFILQTCPHFSLSVLLIVLRMKFYSNLTAPSGWYAPWHYVTYMYYHTLVDSSLHLHKNTMEFPNDVQKEPTLLASRTFRLEIVHRSKVKIFNYGYEINISTTLLSCFKSPSCNFKFPTKLVHVWRVRTISSMLRTVAVIINKLDQLQCEG